MKTMDTMRVCAKIDLNALWHNLTEIKKAISPDTQIVCVIKADAYGHGALSFAHFVQNMDGIWGFAVATCEEAKELYATGIRKPILILGYTFEESYPDVVRYGFRPTIFSMEMAKAYQKVAEALEKDVFCHIKLDTGMGRIGYRPSDAAADEIAKIFAMNRLVPEGIFTHFARADEAVSEPTELQLDKFCGMIDKLSDRGISFTYWHCSNSAGIIKYKKANMDLVRAGIIMYGMMPSEEVGADFNLMPVLSLKSHIVHIKEINAGDPVSYGGTYVAKEKRMIATIPVGYGDGYSRGLSDKGFVLIRGKRAPIVGRVCMDQFMVDVTDIPEAKILDEVTLVGRDGNEQITMEELGALSGRFNYEFACDLGNRIPRFYYKDGKLVETKFYLGRSTIFD